MATKTNSGLVKYAKAQVGLPYWYGTYGQTATAALLKSKKAQYPSYYKASDFESQIGKRVHDCAGIMKGYLWSDSTTGTPTYKSAQDWSAKTIYAKAATKGKISTFPKTAGLLVFKGSSASNISHVGVYGGDGYVYEAKGHAYGVVKTTYKASDWTFWAQDPRLTDDTTSTSTSSTTSTSASSTTSTSTSSTTSTSTSSATSTSTSSTTSASTSKTTITVDGIWGKKTTTALQKILGTTQDGLISNQRTKYKTYLTAIDTASWKFTSSGSSACIKALQKKLNSAQKSGLSVDGIAGPATVKALQKHVSVTQDSIMGTKTVTALQKWINKQ